MPIVIDLPAPTRTRNPAVERIIADGLSELLVAPEVMPVPARVVAATAHVVWVAVGGLSTRRFFIADLERAGVRVAGIEGEAVDIPWALWERGTEAVLPASVAQ